MKLPNGYGSVYKLSGKRRKPWGVRKTIGWDLDENTGKVKQIYKNIGYYESKTLALQALAEFNSNPYDLDAGKITFQEVYEKWSAEKYSKISKSNVNGYVAAYKISNSLYEMKFIDIKTSHLQGVIDTCGKKYPTLRKLKVLFNQLYKYAMENDIASKDYAKYVDIGNDDRKTKRKSLTKEEVQKVWNDVERNEYIQIILMLLYSGVRISELLDLKKENVHIEERYFDVIDSKTSSGIRKVPIAKKVLPYFINWMDKEGCVYLLCTPESKPFKYRNYYDSYWKPFMEEWNIDLTPHSTRHTTISLLAAANVNQTIIKRIVGHSGAMSLTERVYTHFDIQQLVDAIDLI